jgi:hypothetical protein
METTSPRFTFDRESAASIGEMHTVWSEQYRCPCVVVFPQDRSDDVVDHCHAMGALFNDGDGEPSLCVVLRHDIGPELYSEDALRRSIEPRSGAI